MPHTVSRQRQREVLSQFLRGRRAALSPSDVALTASGRRRTPGLRREEVAVLAGVGTSWYTWLEQGRDIRVSESVVEAICRTLRLDRSEREYLYELLSMTPPVTPRALPGGAEDHDLDALVDHLMPNPAMVLDDFWDIKARNALADEVFGLSRDDDNLIVSFFTNAVCRARFVDPDEVARTTVAHFRSDSASHLDHPRFTSITSWLREHSEEFAALWDEHEVAQIDVKHKELTHPRVGRLTFDVNVWHLAGQQDIRLFLYLPGASAESQAKVESLARDARKSLVGRSA